MSQPVHRWRNWGNEKDMFDWHPNSMLNGCGSNDFNTFIRNVIEKRPGYVSELYADYAKPQVDFVGKQETLREDLLEVLRNLYVNFGEKLISRSDKVGVSPEPKVEMKWNPELEEEVLRLEQVALWRYGQTSTEPESMWPKSCWPLGLDELSTGVVQILQVYLYFSLVKEFVQCFSRSGPVAIVVYLNYTSG